MVRSFSPKTELHSLVNYLKGLYSHGSLKQKTLLVNFVVVKSV